MVDVSTKQETRRVAQASCRVSLSAATAAGLAGLPKGDALATARIAGIQAAKRTPEWIPLTHSLRLDHVDVSLLVDGSGVRVQSRVVVHGVTGAEMEALTACAAAALTIYDMVKAVEKSAEITDLRLESKSGGKSGDYQRVDRPQDT